MTPKDYALHLTAPENELHSGNIQLNVINIRPVSELKRENVLQGVCVWGGKEYLGKSPTMLVHD